MADFVSDDRACGTVIDSGGSLRIENGGWKSAAVKMSTFCRVSSAALTV
jgi:hypothetical protein